MAKRTFLTVLFLVCLFFGLALVKVQSAQGGNCNIDISYQGVDNVHLRYEASGCGYSTLNLVASIDGSKTVLLSVGSSDGIYHDIGRSKGQTITYQLLNPPPNDTFVLAQKSVTLTGYLRGTLLFDESVESQVLDTDCDLFSFVVPDEKSFVMRKTQVKMNFSITTQGSGHATIEESNFTPDVEFRNASTTSSGITISDSQFSGTVTVRGAVKFIGNEFGQQLNLYNRSASEFKDNVFAGGINLTCNWDYSNPDCDWSSSGSLAQPVIDNNSFVGPRAIYSDSYSVVSVTPPIPMGTNYYGSFDGYDKIGNPYPARKYFLRQRGAIIQDTGLVAVDPGNYASVGKFISILKPAANSVFMHSWIAGQNSLSHKVTPNDYGGEPVGWLGRETLLSLDLGTTYASLSGIRVYVTFNGHEYSKSAVTLTHTKQSCTGANADKCTVNLILPAVPPDGSASTFRFDAFADLTAVGGPVDAYLGWGNIALIAPPARKFKIDIVPVKMGGFCSGTGNIADVEVYARDIPSVFPLRPQDLDVRVRAPRNYYCWTPLAVSATLIAEGVLGELRVSDKMFATDPPDVVIAVVPFNSMKSWFSSNVDGLTLTFLQGMILVNDANPSAIYHEIGHLAGLWVSPEQYDKYPDAGLEVTDTTAFDPQGKRFAYMAGQVEHFPAYGYAGAGHTIIHDIMSNQNIIWPLADTWKSLLLYFNAKLATPAAPVVQPAAASAPQTETRPLLIFGDVEPSGRVYAFTPGKIGLFDLTETGINPGDSPQPLNSEVDSKRYRVVGYDASGIPVYSAYIYSYDTYTQGYTPSYDYNYHTLQVPLSVSRLRVTDDWIKKVVLDASPTNPVSSHFTAPLNGTILDNALTLTWTDPLPGVWHLLSFSSDNGATWKSLKGMPFQGSSLTLPTTMFPSGSLAFRLYSSDGFTEKMDSVNDLILPNRPPQVSIIAPAAVLSVPPSTPLELSANGYDLEDGDLTTGTWTSSIDGLLGQGMHLAAVILSPGTHTLTFSSTDSQRAPASAQVEVAVAAVTQFDLKLQAGDIQLSYPGRRAGKVDPATLSSSVPYTLRVNLAGASVEVTASLALYVKPSGGSETLLKVESLTIPAFSTGTLTVANYSPPANGEFTFRAAIESASLPDPVATNNQANLVISALPPTYTISGYVWESNSHLVAGAEVKDDAGHSVLTKSGGHYQIGGYLPGTIVTLTASYPGIVFGSSQTVTVVAPNGGNKDFNGTALTYAIYGTVADQNYYPPAGVMVTDGAGHWDFLDLGGDFVLNNVPPGTYRVQPVSDDYTFDPESAWVTITQDNVVVPKFVSAPATVKLFLPFLMRN